MTEFEFDVFLSHNGRDKPLVQALKRLLAKRELKAWLDEDELRPGINWQPLLEAGVRSSKSIAVLIGPDGLGPWEDEEMQAALQLAVQDKRPIIPTLLPDCPEQPDLPLFLGNRTWVDLSGGYTNAAIANLVWGITGQKPDRPPVTPEPPPKAPTTPAELWPDTPAVQETSASDCYRQLNAIHNRGEVPKGEQRKALWRAVKRQRPASFHQWQLANLARWSAPEYLEVEERFTPLRVNVRVRESAEAPAEKQQLPFDTLAEAMDAVFDEHMAPASVVFAPPGGGKSTLLRHYQLAQAQHPANGERLVFYVQLRDYRPNKATTDKGHDIKIPALVWLESEWRKETRAGPSLLDFIRQGSLTLLLDGLNEIPRRNDDEYRARVAEWRELIEAIERSHSGVRLLFACRPLDYSQRLDAGRHTRLPEVEIQAMEPERIKAFIDKRFDAAIATQIWEQLEAHPSLELYSSPYYLNLLLGQIDTEAEDISIPQNRAGLFTGMVRERLRRECQKQNARFDDPELLGKRDRMTIEADKSRGNWLPDDTPFFQALAALAFHIQDASGSNERWGALRWNAARDAMEQALERKLPADVYLEAGCDLGLFEDDAAQAGDIRFILQQMQEYFAAWVLAEQADLKRLAVPWRSADLAESTEVLLDRGGDDDLSELPTTGWEESALIAASLSDAPDDFIHKLMPLNLALAGRCAAQVGVAISDPLRAELQEKLIKRSQDREAYPPPAGPFIKPRYWRSLTWSNPAQPVVGVCWYETQAYCLWLNAMLTSDRYRLPSEAEWEAAGRGRGEWRRYAWPSDFDPLRANTAETRLGVTTPVGVFPEGTTMDTGLRDLCGNVWEWTATPWSEGERWNPTLGSADGAPDVRRVVRGGSWDSSQGSARLGVRDDYDPDSRDGELGFRVCRASPIIEPLSTDQGA